MMYKGGRNKQSDDYTTKESVQESYSMIAKFIQESGKTRRPCRFNAASKTNISYTESEEPVRGMIENSVPVNQKSNLSTIRLHKFKKDINNENRVLHNRSPGLIYQDQNLFSSVNNEHHKASTIKNFQHSLLKRSK